MSKLTTCLPDYKCRLQPELSRRYQLDRLAGTREWFERELKAI